MTNTISLDIYSVVVEVVKRLGDYLKIEKGWYYGSNSNPMFKVNEEYKLLNDKGVYPITNNAEGYLNIHEIKTPGYILDKTNKTICVATDHLISNLTIQPITPSVGIRLVDAMICDLIHRQSKNTEISLKVRDYFDCFDFEITKRKILEQHFSSEEQQSIVVSNDYVRSFIERQINEIFIDLDAFFLQVVQFIAGGHPDSAYITARVGYITTITERVSHIAIAWGKWKEYGILDEVLQFAEKKILEKDSEVSVRIF